MTVFWGLWTNIRLPPDLLVDAALYFGIIFSKPVQLTVQQCMLSPDVRLLYRCGNHEIGISLPITVLYAGQMNASRSCSHTTVPCAHHTQTQGTFTTQHKRCLY